MKQYTQNWVYIIGLLIILFGGMFGITYEHELAHQEIYRHYSIHSTIDMFYKFDEARTLSDRPCPNDFCTLAQNNVDAFGYHLMSAFFFGGLLFIASQVYRLKEVKDEV